MWIIELAAVVWFLGAVVASGYVNWSRPERANLPVGVYQPDWLQRNWRGVTVVVFWPLAVYVKWLFLPMVRNFRSLGRWIRSTRM